MVCRSHGLTALCQEEGYWHTAAVAVEASARDMSLHLAGAGGKTDT